MACRLALVLRLRRGVVATSLIALAALATALSPANAIPVHADAPAPRTAVAHTGVRQPAARASHERTDVAYSAWKAPDEACLLGRAPPLVPQMLALVAILGQTTGEPLECVRANPDNGDLLQQTTSGLLIYRTVSGMAVFTNGWAHWGLSPDGLVSWHGSGLDPPRVELAWTERATAGGPALVVAHTSPGASCVIDYLTPSGGGSRALGLEPQVADDQGQVNWAWRIGPSTRRGTGHVSVTCDGASAEAPLVID